MSVERNKITVTLSLSEDEKTATIRLSSRRKPIISGCLGTERDLNGEIVTIYLDSLIHYSDTDATYIGYSLKGAISTVMNKV